MERAYEDFERQVSFLFSFLCFVLEAACFWLFAFSFPAAWASRAFRASRAFSCNASHAVTIIARSRRQNPPTPPATQHSSPDDVGRAAILHRISNPYPSPAGCNLPAAAARQPGGGLTGLQRTSPERSPRAYLPSTLSSTASPQNSLAPSRRSRLLTTCLNPETRARGIRRRQDLPG